MHEPLGGARNCVWSEYWGFINQLFLCINIIYKFILTTRLYWLITILFCGYWIFSCLLLITPLHSTNLNCRFGSIKQLKIKFDAIDISIFGCEVARTYLTLSKRAWSVLVPFTTTYLCEAGFSTMVHIKDKYHNQLDISHDMGVALSKTFLALQI